MKQSSDSISNIIKIKTKSGIIIRGPKSFTYRLEHSTKNICLVVKIPKYSISCKAFCHRIGSDGKCTLVKVYI